MEAGVVIGLLILAAITVRLLALGLDHDRVRRHVESRGGRVLEAHWSPFGPGWFGDRSNRLYQVRYVDAGGNQHRAHCKTSLFGGVYFTEDQVTTPAEPAPHPESLEEENRRLRAENEELRRGGT